VSYSGFSLGDAPVVLGDPPVAGIASITHDLHGRLTIRVRRKSDPRDLFSMLKHERLTISSPLGTQPLVQIKRAVCTRMSGSEVYDEFWAATALITSETLPPDSLVVRKYYLTGIHFLDGVIEIDAGGFHWKLDLLDDFFATSKMLDAEGSSVVTATLTSTPIPFSRSQEADDAAHVTALLLSFAAGGVIGIVRTDEEREGRLAAVRLQMSGTRAQGFSLAPILSDTMGPGVIKPFIEASYFPAIAVSKRLPLARLILTLLDLRGESVVQIQGLLAAHFLEIVRYHYALNVLVPNGKATHSGDQFYSPNTRRVMSFETILQDFAASIGLTGWSTGFTKFRNRVVHGDEIEGTTPLEQCANVLEVLHFCDRIILALLEWDRAGGKYIPCTDPERVTSTSYGINVKPFTR